MLIVSNEKSNISQGDFRFIDLVLNKKHFYRIMTMLILIISMARAYYNFERTAISFDELQHITTGIELIENGTYELEALHPPFARLVAAIPLYLFKGVRLGDEFYSNYCPLSGDKDYLKEYEGRLIGGQTIFCGSPEKNLPLSEHIERVKLARCSSLLFFFICGIGVYCWCIRFFSHNVALLSVLLYANLPIVLASCVIINTDMAGAAFLIWSLYFLLIWLREPTIGNSLILGICIGLTASSKFSDIIFFAPCFAIAALYLKSINNKLTIGLELSYWKRRLIILCVSCIIIWVMYRLSVGEIYGFKILPFPEFVLGLSELIARNNISFLGYIWGKPLFFSGVWYFFPVATFFKLPLSFLMLFICGLVVSVQLKRFHVVLILLFIASIYFIGAISNINIGLRHMLPAIVLMCIVAAYFIDYFIMSYRHFMAKPVMMTLMGSFIYSSVISDADYISYFNILAGDTPEDILIEGDFDIGQDIKALSEYLKSNALIDKTMFYSYNLVHQECYGFHAGNHRMFFGEKISDFVVTFGSHRYLAISKAVMKFLDKSAYASIADCCNTVAIGRTILLYDKEAVCN